MEQRTVLRHQDDGADKPLLVERPLDDAVDALTEGRRWNALAEGNGWMGHGTRLESMGDAVTIKNLLLKKKTGTVPDYAELNVRNGGAGWTV